MTLTNEARLERAEKLARKLPAIPQNPWKDLALFLLECQISALGREPTEDEANGLVTRVAQAWITNRGDENKLHLAFGAIIQDLDDLKSRLAEIKGGNPI